MSDHGCHGKQNRYYYGFVGFIYLALLCFPTKSLGQVVVDGSLGSSIALQGPEYRITADLGKQTGGNLFHSFASFNINVGEMALFTGSNTTVPIERIIARITGGQPSSIDGMIRSDIPDADLFLLNPSGILFGPNASIKLPGSFYISTADYIRLQDHGYFATGLSSNETVLTTGKPEAFGFLGDQQPADIQFDGSWLDSTNGTTLSVIAGDISFSNDSGLIASQGSLNLISVASVGELRLDHDEIDTLTFPQMGYISLNTDSPESEGNFVSGSQMVIRGGQLIMNNSVMNRPLSENNTQTFLHPQAVDIQLTERLEIRGESSEILISESGNGIAITVPQLQLYEGARIEAFSDDALKPSPVSIHADSIQIEGVTDLSTVKNSQIVTHGNSNLSIHSEQLQMVNGGAIETTGGGDISINAVTVKLDGVDRGIRAGVFTSTSRTNSSGNINLETNRLDVLHGARIATTTFGDSTGKAGTLHISANNIRIEGAAEFSPLNNRSSIQSEAQGNGSGGNLELEVTDSLIIRDGADISARALGSGDGGAISIRASDIILQDRGQITVRSENKASDAGESGSIHLQTSTLQLSGASSVNATTEQAEANDINITTDFLNLDGQSAITTSVSDGAGSGGNININTVPPNIQGVNLLILQNASQITASANKGNGGDINIKISEEGALIQTSDSLIEASSKSGLGIDGNIEINAPDVDITSRLQALPAQVTDISVTLKEACSNVSNGKNTFVHLGSGGLAESPEQAGTVALHQERLQHLLPQIETTELHQLAQKKPLAKRECDQQQ